MPPASNDSPGAGFRPTWANLHLAHMFSSLGQQLFGLALRVGEMVCGGGGRVNFPNGAVLIQSVYVCVCGGECSCKVTSKIVLDLEAQIFQWSCLVWSKGNILAGMCYVFGNSFSYLSS